jgi:acetyl-CoA acetyltransferase
MSAIEVLGCGIHPFGRWPGKLSSEMADVAVNRALEEARIDASQIDVVFAGHTTPESGGGTAVASRLGIHTVPVLNVDQACASSAVATVLACIALGAGQFDTALVLGFDKMGSGFLESSRPHSRHEELLGLDLQPTRYALKASRYLASHAVDERLLAMVTVKSRRHALLNPDAHLRIQVSLEDVVESPMISSPLTRLQCCPTSDGAAAIVLSRSGRARTPRPSIVGWSLGTLSPDDSMDAGVPEVFTTRLARQAYEMAGIGPEDVRVVQVHDAFTIAEPLRLEALGLVPEGEGLHWNNKGATSLGGQLPTNTDGGILSRGHPVGATGLAQLIEIVRQLSGNAGQRQVEPRPSVGICQNLGGGENGGGVVLIVNR